MSQLADANALYRIALRRLSRREHAVAELRERLLTAGAAEDVAVVITALLREGLLSDERYAEIRSATARRRGWGPLRLRHELEAHGVPRETVDRTLADPDRQWTEQAERVRRRRFGTARPLDAGETIRQTQFLRGRGFTMEQIRRILKDAPDDE